MCTIYENIKSLCDQKGIKPGKMCVDTGMSKSILTGLKNGTKKNIQTDTAQKIADYFGVSVDCVLGSAENKNSSTPEGVEPFAGYSDLTIEEKEKVKDYIALLLAARQTQ